MLALASLAAGQGLSKYQMSGQAIASQFNWQVEAQVTAPNGGAGTIQLDVANWTLPDGRAFEPWSAGTPVLVADGAQTETVVIQSSTCAVGGPTPCTLQGNFAHPHLGRLAISSGTQGLVEAIHFLGAAGGTVALTPDWPGAVGSVPATAGSAGVQLVDQRSGREIWYRWNGAAYVAVASVGGQAAGLTAAAIEGVRYADQWCATPGQLDQSCLASATAGFSGDLYLSPGTYNISANLTLPTGIRYRFAPGAQLLLPAGVTVTINGEVDAGNYRIFSLTAPTIVQDGAMTAGTATVTSATANFSPAQVGSKLYISGASAATQFGLHLPLIGTLTAVQNASTATASFANGSGTNLAGATAIFGGSYVVFGTQQTSHLNPIWWGADASETSDSTDAFNEAFTAGGDAVIPVVIPTGNYLVGNLEGGDPMAWGNYSPSAQIGGNAIIVGGGRNYQQVTLHAKAGTTGYVLTRRNFAGGEWSGFAVDGSNTAACLDARWILQTGAPGPSTQDTFRNLSAINCTGVAFELDNQNDATIEALQGSAGHLVTSATTAVAAGTAAPITPASMNGISVGETVIVDSGGNAEAVAVASVTANSFTPFTNWQHAHGPAGYAITIPAIGLSLLASTGEQSVENLTLNNGLFLINVQNGSIEGGFFGQGIEIGGAGTNVVAAIGAQIWANPDLGAAIDASGIGTPQTDAFICTGCQINAAAGQAVIQGSFFAGGTFLDSLILNSAGSQFFGAMTGNTSNPPVFHIIGSVLSNPPNSVPSGNWVATDSYLGGAGNSSLSPYVESSGGAGVWASAATVTPWAVTGVAGQTAPLEVWQVPNVFLDEIDSAGNLSLQGEMRAEKNGAATSGQSALALTWNASGGFGEGNFWDEFNAAQNSSPAFDWRIFDAGGAAHVLATLSRAGTFSTSAGLAAPQLALGNGTPLSGQTGSGVRIVTDVAPAIANAQLSGSLVLPSTYQAGGNTITQPAQAGTLALTSQLPLAATSASVGGSALAAGQCAASTVTVAGASSGMAVIATPVTYPGASFYWRGYVSGANTVTVEVCAVVAGTPAASAYSARVLP